MNRFRLFSLLMTLACLICLALPTFGFSAAWPSKPITVVVPFAAGGSTDATGRILARELEKKLGVRIIVKNVAGATGSIGAAEVAAARPDGYTLGYYSPGPSVGIPNVRKLPYGRDSWEPVSRVFDMPSVIAIDQDSPWQSFEQMVSDIRTNPNKYVYASTGIGGATYLSMKGFLRGLGLQMRHVPERSSADAFKAIAGKTTHMYSAIAPEMQRFNVKSFVYIGDHRSALMPDVPTAKELGLDVPNISNWNALFAPKGTPKEIVEKLSDAIGEICNNPEFIKNSEKMDMQVAYLPADDFKKFYYEQFDVYAGLLEDDKEK